MPWIIEHKPGPRAAWRAVRGLRIDGYATEEIAIEAARDLSQDRDRPDGVTMRVREVTDDELNTIRIKQGDRHILR